LKKKILVLVMMCLFTIGVVGCAKKENFHEKGMTENSINESTDNTGFDESMWEWYDEQLMFCYGGKVYYSQSYTYEKPEEFPETDEATYIGDVSNVVTDREPEKDMEANFGSVGCSLYTFKYETGKYKGETGFICVDGNSEMYIYEVSSEPFYFFIGDKTDNTLGLTYPVGCRVYCRYQGNVYVNILVSESEPADEKITLLGRIGHVNEDYQDFKNDFDMSFGTVGDEVYLSEDGKDLYIKHEYTWYCMVNLMATDVEKTPVHERVYI